MIPDDVSRLIAAFVDKELDADERQKVIRLARRSRRVRKLLLQLHNDARALRSLPRAALGQDLSETVLRQIASQKVRVARQTALKVRDPMPAWVGMATAAAVLLALGAGLYFYVLGVQADRTSAQRKQLPDQLVLSRTPESSPRAEDRPTIDPPRKETASAPAPSVKTIEPKHDVLPGSNNVANSRQPDPKSLTAPEPPLVSGIKPMPPPVRADVSSPLIVPLRDLNQQKWRSQLLAELAKGDGCRIELACQETAAGVARLQEEFEAQGFSFLLDKDAKGRIAVPFPNTSYALYLESVTPNQILVVLERAGMEWDASPKNRGRHAADFEKVSVRTLTAKDRVGFTKLLGLAPSILEPQVVDEVVRKFGGQGGARAEMGHAKNKFQGRKAVVVAAHEYDSRPATLPPLSQEIRQFFEARRERQSGSIRTLIYVNGR
jgi:hypothetical protein